MRDPRKKKLRDLRQYARSGGHNPSIFKLFHRYHPEVDKLEREVRAQAHKDGVWYWNTSEWNIIHNMEGDWATKVAGYWDAIGGAPPAWFRRSRNRLRRARNKAALCRATHNDTWDDFVLPRERRSIRWEWW